MAFEATLGKAALMLTLLAMGTGPTRAKSGGILGGDPIFPPEEKFPKTTPLDDEKLAQLKRDFTAVRTNWLLVGDEKWFLPEAYRSQGPTYFAYETFHNKTWLVNFPTTGTHWAQEAIWLINNDLDYKTAESKDLDDRFPYFESNLSSNENKSEVSDQLLSRPEFFKTHLPFTLVPQILKSGSKTVYFAKNPKDTAVSYYHYLVNSPDFEFVGTFEKFWDYFENDETMFSPYWSHLKEGWYQKDNIRVLFVFCEEVSYDPVSVLKKMGEFFEKSYTDEQYSDLLAYLQHHYKIEIETWHRYFTPELNNKATQWFIDNLENTDIAFPHINIFG